MPAANNKKAVRSADSIDGRVGDLLRARRLELGLSQTAVADMLGLTFQQVQKYKKGQNRLGAGRLQQVCTFLKVDPNYFFEPSKVPGDKALKEIDDFVRSKDGSDLVQTMRKVNHKQLRLQIVRLVEVLASAQDTSFRPMRRTRN